MIALLHPIQPRQDLALAIQQAVLAFKRREFGLTPAWIELGPDLPEPKALPSRLRQVTGHGCRPGHIMVGVGKP